jgi:hypothetical protein
LDITVIPTDDGRAWTLTDLLGRPMGRITEASAQPFTIHPDGHALKPLSCIDPEPFAPLEAALAAAEKHDRSGVRRNPDEYQR